jgi:rhodanese-related sulfurtransferase
MVSQEPAIDRVLAGARARIATRVSAPDLAAAVADGAMVVDIRPSEQRDRDGPLPGAVVVDRNVLEWRLDPTSPHRLTSVDDPARPVIIVCNEGYASSLAAASLADLGLTNVTDLDGGYQAWKQAAGS